MLTRTRMVAKKSLSLLMASLLIISLLATAMPAAMAASPFSFAFASSTTQGKIKIYLSQTIKSLPTDPATLIPDFTISASVTETVTGVAKTSDGNLSITVSPALTASSSNVTVTYNADPSRQIIAGDSVSVLGSFSVQPVEINAAKPVITNDLTDVSTPEGVSVSLDATATAADVNYGGLLSYQWYLSADGTTGNASPVANATSAAFTPPVKTMDGSYYYCKVTNTNTNIKGSITDFVNSNVALVTVTAPTDTAAPVITQDLTDKTTNVGSAVSLNAVSTVPDNGMITYAWYQNETRSTTGSLLISEATGASLSPNVSVPGTKYYYCIVTSTNNDATNNKTAETTSAIVQVTVNALVNSQAPVISQDLTDITTTETLDVTLNATAAITDGGLLTYQWYIATAADKTGSQAIAEGGTNATYLPPVTAVGTAYYYCVVTNTNTAPSITGSVTTSVSSAVAKVSVLSKPVINSIEITSQGDVSLTFDTSKSFSLATYPGAQDYFTVTVDGKIDAVTSVTKTNTGNKIKLVLTTKANAGQNVSVTYIYNSTYPVKAADGSSILSFAYNTAAPVITSNLTSTPTTVGVPVTLDATSTASDNGTLSYQWYSAAASDKSGAAMLSGEIGATYSPPVSTIGTYYYYCVITNTNSSVSGSKTATTISSVATVTVSAAPETYLNALSCTSSTNNGSSYTILSSAKIYGNANPIPIFKVTFDRNVTVAAAQGLITLSGSNGSIPVQCTVAADPNSLIITPNTAPTVGIYTLTIGSGLISADGKTLQNNVTYTINVISNPLSITSVTCNGSALNGATISDLKPEIKITCDRGMVENLSSNINMIKLYRGSTLVSTNIYMKTTLAENDDIEKHNIYVMPVTDLTSGTYTLQVLGGLKANNGNTLSDVDSVVYASYTFIIGLGTIETKSTAIQVTPTTINGTSTASVSSSEMQSLIEAAKATEAGGGMAEAVIEVKTSADTKSVSLTISGNNMSSFASGTSATLTINTGIGSVTFPAPAVDSISRAAGTNDVVIKIDTVVTSTLSADVQKAIGNRLVYDFSVTAGGTAISTFGGSSVTVSIPYTLQAGEDPNNILIYYISASGALVTVPACVYDPATSSVTFATTHFSRYAVGYNKVIFTDVWGWYTSYVSYLSARGIINGIGDSKFDPDGTITRAAFVTILANLSGADLSVYKVSAFTDVKTTDWYFKAVQWANANGIVLGYDGKFSPNSNLSRQDLAVILSRYAVKIGYALPVTENAVSFVDSTLIASYAAEAVKAMQRAAVLTGYTDGSFGPQKSATRAETSKIIAVFVKGSIE